MIGDCFLVFERKNKDRTDGEADTDPLPGVEAFTEDEERTDERPHGAGSLQRTDDRDGQVLDRDIAEDPRTEDDHGLEDGEEMGFRIERRDIEMRTEHEVRAKSREDQRNREHQGRYTDTKRQDIDHAIIPESDLLADIIKAQADRGYESQKRPHTQKNMQSYTFFCIYQNFSVPLQPILRKKRNYVERNPCYHR